ncbi:MAG: TIGR03013 family PEP-CTERM/XrtA system glycosyltransferase [Nitrospirota bacterium]|nr:TIGR03013 family PEP-CTERM/XrtA system glycosyltransferase [Nitrospirota bacterium]
MATRFSSYSRAFLSLGDAAIILLSAYVAFALRWWTYVDVMEYRAGATILFVLIYGISFAILDIHNYTESFRSTAYLTHFIITVLMATGVVTVLFYVMPLWKFGRGVLLINMAVVTILVYSWRLLFEVLFKFARKPLRMIVIGSGFSGKHIYDILRKHPDAFTVIGFLDDDPGRSGTGIGEHRVLGGSGMLMDLTERRAMDAVVIAITGNKTPRLLTALVDAKMKGVEVYDMPDLYEEITGKLPADHIGDAWMAYARFKGVRRNLYTLHLKRIMDILQSVLGLILSLPIAIIAAIAIKLDSRGPVLYQQARMGKNECIFTLCKFRSMRSDAEDGAAVWASPDDPRITRVGMFLRKTRIDEIPQMWNVLKGEMSFIGPRPERPEFIAQLKKEVPFYSFRHAVQPGITGWAQVNYRYGASKEDALEKLHYDLYYIKNLSFTLDMHVLLKTIRVVLFGKGAR